MQELNSNSFDFNSNEFELKVGIMSAQNYENLRVAWINGERHGVTPQKFNHVLLIKNLPRIFIFYFLGFSIDFRTTLFL